MNKPTTLITGAGVRIGAMLAAHLAAKGHNLVLHYHRSGEAAKKLGAELAAKHGTHVAFVQADLEQVEQLTDFWKTTHEGVALPPVTTIIHNASHYTRDAVGDFSPAILRRHLAVNLEAPLVLSQGFLAQLPAGNSGNVIILGDGAHGWSISPEFFTYSISKHAWASLIDLLAASCAPRARANLIALGPTLPGATDSAELFDRLAARAPLKRTGSPDEVARTVDFLLGSDGITGQTLSLSGGFNLTTERPA